MKAIERLISQTLPHEAILVTSDVNRRYLSGFDSSAGAVLVTHTSAYLFLDFRYREMGELAQKRGTIPAVFSIQDAASWTNLKKICEQENIRKIHFEDRRMTCAELGEAEDAMPDMEFEPLLDRLELLRVSKTEEELRKIRAAQALTEEAFLHVLSCFSKNVTDTALAAEIDCYFRRHGAENAFETILVSGPRTSLPHGKPEGELLVPNGFVTMDFGAKVDGYCSDMTRTVVFGKADEEMRALYQLVRDAQDASFAVIRAGVTGKEVDSAARDLIYNAGYEGCFDHGTGHSLGLEIHESPNFNQRGTTPIPAGAVLSVEPGVYLPGKYGVRIEDIICVTENGFENLTHAEKALLEV